MKTCKIRGFVFFLALGTLPLVAQTGLGVVQGTVQDSSGAVVPNAGTTLTNTATGVAHTSQTNAAGIYYYGSIPIGPYTLKIEAAGFRKWEGTLRVEVGQTVVVDVMMDVGSLESAIEVMGAAPVVSTQGAQVSDVKDAERIHQLPLNGRFVSDLFTLTPGVEGGVSGPEGETGGDPRVNGMKVGSTEMLLDGISYVDRFGGGISRVQPGLDTIQEYRIETAGSGAQYQRPATIELVTKSGTNQFHGAAFETLRNNADGLRARARQDGDTSAKLIRNEYGVSGGGPIIKNKIFWFTDYEGFKQREHNFAVAAVPTSAMWNGDFSNAVDINGNHITIYDPLTTGPNGTRTPFSNNAIPTNRLSQFAQTMQSLSPVPSGPNAGGNPWTSYNFQTYYPKTVNADSFTLKGDYVVSEKDSLSARFTRSVRSNDLLGGQYGFPAPGTTNATGTGREDSNVYSQYVRWNHVFSPTFLNQLQLSAHRSSESSGTLADSTNWDSKLGLPNPFGAKGWPTICTNDTQFLYYGCWDADNRNSQQLTAYQIDDNVTWIKGRHTLKFGAQGRQEFDNVGSSQQAQGFIQLYSDWTSQYDPVAGSAAPYTGSGLASLLLGLPTTLTDKYNRGYFYFRQKEFGLYANDTWRVSSRLTLDFGLRWDNWTPYKEKYDRLVNLDLNNYLGKMQVITPNNTTIEQMPGIPPAVLESWKLRGLTWVTADSIHFPSGLFPANWLDFSPRLGVAYKLRDKWVLRAGFGTYYWPMPLSQILASSASNPPLKLNFVNDLTNLNGTVDFNALSHAPVSNDYIGRATVDINGTAGISNRAQAMMPLDVHHWSDDMMQEWTFTLEHELMKDTALRLSYVGNHGSNLEQRWRWNDPESEWNYQVRTGLAADSGNPDPRRPNPNWTSGCCNAPIEHNGFSNSQSLQVNIERRFANGFAFQAFYAYTHAMTTNDTEGFSYGPNDINATGTTGFAVPGPTVILGEPNMTQQQLLRLGYTNSSAVPPHRVGWNGIYELPFGRGKKFATNVSRPLNQLIGGWQLAWIGTLRSGYWSSVCACDYLFGSPTLDASQRLTMNIFGRTQELWFKGDFDPTQATNVNLSALEQLVPVDRSQRVLRPLGPNFDNKLPFVLVNGVVRMTTVADMVNWNARNFFLGPGAWNQDISIFKYFELTERLRLRFTADFFNVFNHPVDLSPNATTGLVDLSRQSNDPRIIQFSARIQW